MNWKQAAFSSGLLYFMRTPGRFPDEYVERLRQSIIGSPYLADNNLNYRFSGTYGFSVIFREDGREDVARDFPLMEPYLEAALDARCNAFFLNPLVMSDVARVAPHVDRSLRSVTKPVEPPNPRRVSVLYLEVPSGMRGGALVLYRNWLPIARLRPRVGMLLQFQGCLRHEVTEVRTSGRRVSLVCEQYVLPPQVLERVPRFTVRSMSSFDAFLEAEVRPRGGGPAGPPGGK